jgi:beta-lactam-binding protein with PASTA domain
VSFIKSGMSAIGRLLIIVALLGAFLAGLFGVVIFSLRGAEIQVPEIVGKNFGESEKELLALGLKIKKRATRYSQEAPNTVLEQLPRPGETVKTGQLVLVVISRSYTEGDETPVEVEKETNENTAPENDNEPINTALTKKDKPKKDTKKANSNANSNTSAGNNNSSGDNKNSSSSNDNSKGTNPANNSNNKNNNRSTAPANTAKPVPAKTPATSGEMRNRRNP